MLRYSPTRFPATVERTRTMGELAITETRYASDAALAPHAHEYACLVVVLAGEFDETFGCSERAGEPGMVIVRPEGEPHSNRFREGGGRCLNVELAPRWIARVREQSPSFDTISAAFTSAAITHLGKRLHDELANDDDLSPIAAESIVLAMFADGVRDGRRAPAIPPRWLLQVRSRLHDDFASRVTLDELARPAGVHPVHLASTFRQHFGQTVAGYVRQLRIEYACRALRESEEPLAEIALAAGFADQSHFGRMFKRALRVTPAEYRGERRRLGG